MINEEDLELPDESGKEDASEGASITISPPGSLGASALRDHHKFQR